MNILHVAEALGAQLKRVSGEHVGPCPVCGGTDRFSVNVKKGIWNCRQCAKGGDAIALVRHIQPGVTFADAARFAGEEYKIAAPKRADNFFLPSRA
jgi:phage/plasmid primase-like uncharacterized protein